MIVIRSEDVCVQFIPLPPFPHSDAQECPSQRLFWMMTALGNPHLYYKFYLTLWGGQHEADASCDHRCGSTVPDAVCSNLRVHRLDTPSGSLDCGHHGSCSQGDRRHHHFESRRSSPAERKMEKMKILLNSMVIMRQIINY